MSAICRGCGGTGLDHTLTPREIQMVSGIFYCHRGSRRLSLEIVPVDKKARLRTGAHGPLAYVLEIAAHYVSLGYADFERDLETLRAVACSWCHGTGVPQLSAATMRAAVRA